MREALAGFDHAFVEVLLGSGVAIAITKAVAMLASACGLESVAAGHLNRQADRALPMVTSGTRKGAKCPLYPEA